MPKSTDSQQASFYEDLPKRIPGKSFLFMNHGFAQIRKPNRLAWLRKSDHKYLYNVQLLNQVVLDVDLKGGNVLEVGSGRGGNSVMMAKYFEPKSVIGLEYSKEAVRFCKRHHRLSNLRFVHGSAMSLSFERGQFDIVVNIESSHCYPDLTKFYKGVHRTLRNGGQFCYADCSAPARVALMTRALKEVGFKVRRKVDITENVARGLKLGEAAYRRMMLAAARNKDGREYASRICDHIFGVRKEKYLLRRANYTIWQLEK